MTFIKALQLVEEFKFIKDSETLSSDFIKAINALKHDINGIKKNVQNNVRENLSWKEMAFSNYSRLLGDFYDLKQNAQEFINKRNKYDLNPNGPIAKAILLSTNVRDDRALTSAKKTVSDYKEVYSLLKELTVLIREYNNKKLGTFMNIPSVEFKIPLREEVEDVFHENDAGFNGENKKDRSRL